MRRLTRWLRCRGTVRPPVVVANRYRRPGWSERYEHLGPPIT